MSKLGCPFWLLRIGLIEVGNRILPPAQGIGCLHNEGCVTDHLIEYYDQLGCSPPDVMSTKTLPIQHLEAGSLEFRECRSFDVRLKAQPFHTGNRRGQRDVVMLSAVRSADGMSSKADTIPREMTGMR